MRYEHRCPEHGEFVVERPMSERRQIEPCPVCNAASRRVFSVSGTQVRIPMRFRDPIRQADTEA